MDFIVYGLLKKLIGQKETALVEQITSNHDEVLKLIEELDKRLCFIANSTDEELDQIAELVNFIKENRESILLIFKDKVNIADIVDNLTTVAIDKPLSANQGQQLRLMIENLQQATTQVVNELEQSFNTKITNLDEAINTKIDLLRDILHDKIDDLSEDTSDNFITVNHNLSNLEHKHDTNVNELNVRINNLTEKHDTELTELNADLTTKIDNLITKHDTELTELNTTINSAINNQNTELIQNITSVDTSLKNRIKALEDAVAEKNASQDTALANHLADYNNPHKVTKNQVGLGNVENKNSETIRNELTKTNVVTALGYTPMTPTEVTNAINNTPPFIVSTTAPSNTKVFWVDPNIGLKYHNGSSWVIVPTAWS